MNEKQNIAGIIKENGIYNGKDRITEYYIVNAETVADALIARGYGNLSALKAQIAELQSELSDITSKCKILYAQREQAIALAHKFSDAFDKLAVITSCGNNIQEDKHEDNLETAIKQAVTAHSTTRVENGVFAGYLLTEKDIEQLVKKVASAINIPKKEVKESK